MKYILNFLFLTLAFFATPTLAQTLPLPALFDVSGVAHNDVLNVRDGPATSFAIVAALGPEITGVEVVEISQDAKWGLISLPETAGWVSLRFMALQSGQDSEILPRPLSCFGTEPFWALQLDHYDNRFDRFDGPSISLPTQWQGSPTNRQVNSFGLHLGDGGAQIHAVITRQRCDDGMSNGEFGLKILAILSGSIGPEIISGCCTLAQR